MPESRRTPQDALVTTAGHPNDQYEGLEKLFSKCFDVYLSTFKHIKYLWNGKLALCLKTAGHRRTLL